MTPAIRRRRVQESALGALGALTQLLCIAICGCGAKAGLEQAQGAAGEAPATGSDRANEGGTSTSDSGSAAGGTSGMHDGLQDADADAARDAGTDGGRDARVEGATDAGADTGVDPGAPCVVDFIWAIDSSPSMALVLDTIEPAINAGLSTLLRPGIDVHIVLISSQWRTDPIYSTPIVGDPVLCIEAPIGSGDCSAASNPPGYQHLTECPTACYVASHNGLGRLITAYPYYKAALRKDSLKYFGIVTDDTSGDTLDFAGEATQFTTDVSALDPGWFDEWKFFGIINPSTGGAYQMLADQTGGVTGQLSANAGGYPPIFEMLTDTILASRTCK